MRRSVVIAGIVVAAMSVAPATASADVRPVAAVDEAPADCRPAAPGPQGGSGTGDTATGGDRSGAAPGAGDEGPGEKPDEEKPDQEKPDEEKPAEEKPDEEQPAEKPAGTTQEPSGREPAGGSPSDGDEPTDEQAGATVSGGTAGSEAAADEEPPEDKGGEPVGEKPESGGSGGQVSPGDDEPGEPADGQQGGDEPDEQEPGGAAAPGAEPAECPAPGAAVGADTSAATIHDWGTPNRVDEFDGDLSAWSIYDGKGHAGNGRRSPEAASVRDGILTIDGDSDGKTAGMAWNPGQKYGRWEGRVRAPASDESYNALLLLWPDAENFPVGGEVDFMEMTDHTRQETELFLHYGADNSQVQGKVKIDATQWHNWAVEWTPEKVTAYVDGKEWWSTSDTSILPPGPMHLCIQLDWFPGNGSGGDVTPSKMEVDWVRQYSLPEGDQEGLLEGASQTLDRLVRRTEGAPDPVQPGVTGTP